MAAGVISPSSLSTLFVVATPIGNYEDITFRAIRVLKECHLVAAENTSRTRQLLRHFQIGTRVISYREDNRDTQIVSLTNALAVGPIALVSDAGLPAIADPGAELIARVHQLGGRVEVVPGANAAMTALAASGFSASPFAFYGFISRRKNERREQLRLLQARRETLVFYEAPHRLLATLRDMLEIFGDRDCAICRELTKLHEEVRRERLSESLAHFMVEAPRGEFTLVITGAANTNQDAQVSDEEVDALLWSCMSQSTDMKADIVLLARETGHPRRDLYNRWQRLRRTEPGNGG